MSTSNTTRYVRRNKKLTNALRNIFGKDVIEAVYRTVTTYDCEPKKDKEETLRKLTNIEGFTITDDKIRLDCETILVKFKNGNLVKFWNSEWASLTKEELKDFKNL